LNLPQQREEKQQPKNQSVGVGSAGETLACGGGDELEISKTSSATFGDNNGDHEADEDGKESNCTGATLDSIASSASSGEKAKRLVVPHHCGWK
jgi:hypothetical protein